MKQFKQKGFLLLELLIVMGIAAAAFAMWANTSKYGMEKKIAQKAGVKMSIIADGLRGYLAENRTAIVGTSATTTYPNLNFLKSSGCGGVLLNGYLPCSFNKSLPLSLTSFTIKIGRENIVRGVGSPNIAVAKIELGPYVKVAPWTTKPRLDLTQVLIDTAKSTSPIMASPVAATTNVEWNYDTVIASPTFGKITGYVNTTANNGPWLRVDGGNQMVGNLNVGTAPGVVNATVATNGNVNGKTIIGSIDVKTGAGRSLNKTTVFQDVIAMKVWPPAAGTGIVLNSFNYYNIATASYTCGAGTSLKVFASVPAYGNDGLFNAQRLYAITYAGGYQIRFQLHTGVGWVAVKGVPYLQYSLRCL